MKVPQRLCVVSNGLVVLLLAAAGCGGPALAPGSGDDVPIVSGAIAPSWIARGWQQLSGHVKPGMTAAPKLGRMDLSAPVTVTIGLPVRDREALARGLEDVSNPTSPTFRQYLTPEEFGDRFGAPQEDYEKVIDWARAQRLTVTPYGNRLVAAVTGTVADVESALHVRMLHGLRGDGTRFFGPDREPSLDLDVRVEHIGDLDDFEPPQRASTGGSGSGGSLFGLDYRHAYAPCTALKGAGQSIGILSLGDGFLQSDFSLYAAQARLGRVPSVVIIGPSGLVADLEDSLDVQMAVSMAPEAQIVAFRGGADLALTNMAAHPEVKQFSSSYFLLISSTVQNALDQLAFQGQSFFQASGDSGAYNTGSLASASQDFRRQLSVMVVGGTNLNMSSHGASFSSETGWNQSGGGIVSTTVGSDGIGTGLPSYQVGFANGANQASTIFRNLPDVSMPATSVQIVQNGAASFTGGTSSATPLWAGFMALINQQAQANGIGTLGFANPAFYLVAKSPSYASSFHDVTSGSNPTATPPAPPVVTFNATTGYDLVTGLGSPACGLIGTLGNPRSSKVRPSQAEHNGLLHMAYIANNSSNALLHISSTDGLNWGPEVAINGLASGTAPAMVSFGGLLHLFFTANDATGGLRHITSSDGVTWSSTTLVGSHASKASPTATVFNNQIHLAYIANNATNQLLHVASSDGVSWGTESQVAGQSSAFGPSLVVFNDQLFLFFTANDSTHNLYKVTSSDGTSWSTNVSLSGHTSEFAPSATVMNAFIFVAYIAHDGTNRLLVDRSSDGTSYTQFVANGRTSKAGPSALGFNSGLRLSYLSNNTSNLLLRMTGTVDATAYGPETVW